MTKKLSPDDLRSRLRFDYQVCQRMFDPTSIIQVEAYRSTSDLDARRNQITSLSEAHLARKYRADFHIKTLIGKGKFADLTTIGFDLATGNYPYDEPTSWVISKPIPYSPHFKSGKSVCTSSLWETSNGRMLLGQLLVHVAMILNWDTTTHWNYGTNLFYKGEWNPDAAIYYYNLYGKEPISKNLRYPSIPVDLVYGTQAPLGSTASGLIANASPDAPSEAPSKEVENQRPLFRPHQVDEDTENQRPLFRPHKADDVAPSRLFRRRED